ncbi:hypothetical protein [Priestia koreensis]|uniref:hypothetical protein n=1 Tax=Priestia koreensis TaxID=284581 RepID=UPI00203DAB91|nr:hypothetical protein [Priestia koreensis]MCM3005698.1 hypothetical protein [Priestia koreensis]
MTKDRLLKCKKWEDVVKLSVEITDNIGFLEISGSAGRYTLELLLENWRNKKGFEGVISDLFEGKQFEPFSVTKKEAAKLYLEFQKFL